MSNGMKIFIVVAVFLILWKHPELITEILHAISQGLNG